MTERGYSLGGEQSGHIIFAKYATTGDGVLTSLKIMQAMLDKKMPLSALVAPMKKYPQILRNVRVTDKTRAKADPLVQTAVAEAEQKLQGRGRILLRESGTEPVLRVMVEAESEGECEEQAQKIVAAIERSPFFL